MAAVTPLEQVERWFVRRGVPQVIHDYRATTDVFTRMVPYLVMVFLFGALASFGDRFRGWTQAAVFFGAIAVFLAAAAVLNRVRDRRPFELPERFGFLEVVLFLAGAPLLGLLTSTDRRTVPWALLGANILLMLVGYVVTSYALLPMIRWGAKQMVRELSGLATLVARTLPLMLLFATFIFINAEMWQVAQDLTWQFYAIVIGLLLFAAMGFLMMRLPTEMLSLETFHDWSDVHEVITSCSAPLAGSLPSENPPVIPPLGRRERFNIAMLMLTAKVVQMVLVGALIGAFYVAFGLLTVREQTLQQWTTGAFEPLFTQELFGAEIIVTWDHFAVAGFIAAISALQFAVSSLTDDDYRATFNHDLEVEIREVLAVRALYRETIRREGDLTAA